MSMPFPMPPGMPGFSFPFPLPQGLPSGLLAASSPSVDKALAEEVVLSPDDCEPNETLYVNNLNSRVKEKELRSYLQKLFGKFGKCEVIAMSSLRRRGQAWIVFQSIDESKAAKDELQSQLAFGKRMRVSFSRNMSDATRLAKGVEPREKRTTPLEAPAKRQKTTDSQDHETFFNTSTTVPKAAHAGAYNPPNKILFVENMSETTSVEDMTALFSSYAGFVEARLIPGRGVGFIEFIDEYQSQIALSRLQGFEMVGRLLTISNAKR